jgi:uncharacterized protein YegP (UPF0339 family)
MTDTRYQITHDNEGAYRVRITRLGEFVREAEGFASREDAAAWVAQDQHLAVIDEQKEPIASAHLRVV